MNKKLLVAAALITVGFWGTTFVSTKLLLAYLSPIQIMLARYLIGYAGLFAIYPKLHRSEGWKQEGLCLGAALSGSTLYFLCENFALSYTQASNVSLLISAAPIFTSLAAHLVTREEKLTSNVLYGFAAAFTGIFLVVCNGHFILKLSPKGDLLTLCAALSWAVYSLLLRRMRTVYKPVYLTRRIFFYSILTMLPLFAIGSRPVAPEVLAKPVVWGNLLFLGLVASALCYVLWYHVVNGLGAVKANSFVYLNPLVTMITSVVVLHEKITWLMAAGAVLILLGVMIAEGTLFRRGTPIGEAIQ